MDKCCATPILSNEDGRLSCIACGHTFHDDAQMSTFGTDITSAYYNVSKHRDIQRRGWQHFSGERHTRKLGIQEEE